MAAADTHLRPPQAALKLLQREGEELRKEQFRQGQSLFALRQRERELINEITGGWATSLGPRLRLGHSAKGQHDADLQRCCTHAVLMQRAVWSLLQDRPPG
jgi:hypothetical protein